MKKRLLVCAGVAMILAVGALEARAQVFTDGTFADADWDLSVITMKNGIAASGSSSCCATQGGTTSATQLLSGGAPAGSGPYRDVGIAVEEDVLGPAIDTEVVGFHRFLSGHYDPGTQGQIASIDYSEDAITIPPSGAQATGPALRQNGIVYANNTLLLITIYGSTWTPLALTGLTAADFGAVGQCGSSCLSVNFIDTTQHPDFSSAGGPIDFGFFRGNSTRGGAYTTDAGIDNWRVSIARLTTCGDGVVQAGEECDDGNSDPSDGCTNSCTICGNGVVTAPEQCDDGGLVAGDGCSPTCHNECVPVDCDDADPCTDDACDSASAAVVCVHTANTSLCDDGDPCTSDVCDSAGGSFVCGHTAIVPCCGNGMVEGGETCDPPDASVNPTTGQTTCRPDCTFCGDRLTQTGDGETCDDGNTVSGCDPAHPRRPLDACQNNCTAPICSDPAKIVFGSPHDSLSAHGRLIALGSSVDPTGSGLAIELRNPDGVVFRATLPPGAITRAPSGFKYSGLATASVSGITALRIVPKAGYDRLTIKGYGNLATATADMTTHVFLGSSEWTMRGLWTQTPTGWRLTARSPLLQP